MVELKSKILFEGKNQPSKYVCYINVSVFGSLVLLKQQVGEGGVDLN